MIFDTHAHYDDEAFDTDRDEILMHLAAEGVGRVLNVGASVAGLAKIPPLTERYDFLYGAAGLHPDEVGGLTPEVTEKIRELIRRPKYVAVGEIGLDYHWDVEPHEVQIRGFKEQIRLAWEVKKPILVHSRNAAADTMAVLLEMYGDGGELAKKDPELLTEFRTGKRSPGIIHSYSGSYEQSKIYAELGFSFGIGGVITYSSSKKLKKVVAGNEIGRVVLETDSPYLSPEPLKGTRNTSANLHYVARAIAELKGMTEEEVIRITEENANRMFGL